MTDLGASEKKYAAAMQRVFTDEKVKKDLERDPAGTLEKLGFTLSPAARAEIAAAGAGGAKAEELAFGAFPAVLVRVVTSGTQPAVRVVTASSTIAATREPVKAAKSPAKPKAPKR